MTYLIDSDVFIQAEKLHYGMDFCPAFWDWLDDRNQAGQVFSIEKVESELVAGDDSVSEWALEQGGRFFLPPDDRILGSLQIVSQWVVNQQQYNQSAVNVFLQAADYYLVAHALGHEYVVVTHEQPSDGKKVKIPNVCIGLKVRCMTPFEMLRRERARFVLGK